MPEGRCTVLGGLPLWAKVSYDYENVDSLHWMNKWGEPTSEINQNLYDKIEQYDRYWSSTVTEQVSEAIAYEEYIKRYPPEEFHQIPLT